MEVCRPAAGLAPTVDPAVFVEERRERYVRYRRVSDGRRWVVHGECAYRGGGHGPCQEGAADPDIGPPDGRLDNPVTPELDCALCVGGGHLFFEELAPAGRRIVVPALAGDCPAAQALRMENLLPEVRLVGGDDLAYGRLLRDVWREGRGFVLVEHDVVPWPGALAALWACEGSYCGYCYLLGRAQLGGALGCVRFSEGLLRAHPSLADGWADVPWYALDGHVASQMRGLGIGDYHVHRPPVGHAPAYAED